MIRCVWKSSLRRAEVNSGPGTGKRTPLGDQRAGMVAPLPDLLGPRGSDMISVPAMLSMMR